MKLLITGGAGYIGAMLAEQYSKRGDVTKIICVDIKDKPKNLESNDKIIWIQENLADNNWQDIAIEEKPEVVIHTAWQIREMYGAELEQHKLNIDGSNAVFDFVFAHNFVKKLVHFSTVSSYGANKDNSIQYAFKETDKLKEAEYKYGIEKKIAEENLKTKYNQAIKLDNTPQVFVLRPATITGPRGRNSIKKFTLISALKSSPDSAVPKFVRTLLRVMPIASDSWCRQFIHEDDVCNIVELLAFKENDLNYEVFNISPQDIVLGKDMAEIMHKKILRVPTLFVRIAFFIAWHITRGKIPTPQGGWRFYTYPIVVDGTKLTKTLGYNYKYTSRESLANDVGRYSAN